MTIFISFLQVFWQTLIPSTQTVNNNFNPYVLMGDGCSRRNQISMLGKLELCGQEYLSTNKTKEVAQTLLLFSHLFYIRIQHHLP